MSAAASAPIRVLLVEDDSDLRAAIALALAVAGYAVTDVESAEAAVAAVVPRDQDVDIVLTDVVLPNMNGVDLARKLHSWRPKLKVLYMSGYTERILDEYGLKGADASFLAKPFTLEDLEEKIHEQLQDCPGDAIRELDVAGGHLR